MENYRKIKLVGRGNFGCAVLVQSTINRKSYIMKLIDILRLDCKQRQDALNEVIVLKELKHPYIITYRESFLSKNRYLCIVMDYCEGGDLYQQIKEQKKKGRGFPEQQILEWFVQICLGLVHIHDRRILHRDLKTQNIFLTSNGLIKIGDFGIAKVLQHTFEMAETAIGTPYYLSPEICQSQPYNQKTDIWSLGCILYELSTLRHAFDAKNQSSLVIKILKGTYPQIPSCYSKDLCELISEMLQKLPKKRPSIKKILEKPFLVPIVTKIIQSTLQESNRSQSFELEYIQQMADSIYKQDPQIDKVLQLRDDNPHSMNYNNSKISNSISPHRPSSLEQQSVEIKKQSQQQTKGDFLSGIIQAQQQQRPAVSLLKNQQCMGVALNKSYISNNNISIEKLLEKRNGEVNSNKQLLQPVLREQSSNTMPQQQSQFKFQLQQHILKQKERSLSTDKNSISPQPRNQHHNNISQKENQLPTTFSTAQNPRKRIFSLVHNPQANAQKSALLPPSKEPRNSSPFRAQQCKANNSINSSQNNSILQGNNASFSQQSTGLSQNNSPFRNKNQDVSPDQQRKQYAQQQAAALKQYINKIKSPAVVNFPTPSQVMQNNLKLINKSASRQNSVEETPRYVHSKSQNKNADESSVKYSQSKNIQENRSYKYSQSKLGNDSSSKYSQNKNSFSAYHNSEYSEEYFEESEDQRVKCEQTQNKYYLILNWLINRFLGIDGKIIPGMSERDSISNRIEALKVYLEKNLGEDLFIAAYSALSSLSEDLNESDQMKQVKQLMKNEQQKFIPLIFQMICCEDSFYQNS